MNKYLYSEIFLDCLKEFYIRILDGKSNTRMAIEWLSDDTKEQIDNFTKNKDTLTFINLVMYVINDIKELESKEMRYSIGCHLFGTQWEDT